MVQKVTPPILSTYAAGQESDVQVFDLTSDEVEHECFDENYDMKHSGHSASDNNEESDVCENEFTPISFRRISPFKNTIKTFDESSCDSWSLSDLYSKSPSKSDESDPMLVLKNKHEVLKWAVNTLTLSSTANAMIAEASKNGWAIALDKLDGTDFHLDVPEKLIILDNQDLEVSAIGRSPYFKNTLLIACIRALRDVWQEKRHGAFDEKYGAENVLLLERVRAADLDVVSVMVAWELRSENQNNLWRHLIGSADGDIAMRFSGYLERDPSSSFKNKALAAAFEQWFRNERRINDCDHEALNYLDSVVESEEGEQNFGHEKLTPVGIEVLSCLTDKTAYLQGRGREILNNPIYSGLNDEINQAHFMQIQYDLKVVRVQSVPFRSTYLADKIFPNGEFTPELKGSLH